MRNDYDQTNEDSFGYEVSDEALENAAITQRQPHAAATLFTFICCGGDPDY